MSLIPVDKLYLENLEEFIFDDRKFISYKFLSCKLGVHVNLAKQMLYQFLEKSKAKGKEIHAMYYISGVAPQKWIFSRNFPKDTSSKSDKQNKITAMSPDMFASPPQQVEEEESSYSNENVDGYLVMLCQDHELEDLKKKFTEIFSIHVYGLSAFSMDQEKLEKEIAARITDDEGRGPVHYGSITCKAASEFRPSARLASIIQNIQQVKAAVKEDKDVHDKAQPEKKKETKKIAVAPISSQKKDKSVDKAPTKDRLKNMFAAAASKPKVEKPKPKEVEIPIVKKRKSSDEETPVVPAKKGRESSFTKTWNSKRKEAAKSKKERESQSRKRKRIRDVFSSSSDEESESDKKKISDDEDEEEETFPESPIPRKKVQIESDSDDEDLKSQPTTPASKKNLVNLSGEGKTSTGKKRVSKTIAKRHVDEEGFLVTVMEQVMVSESDHSDVDSEKDEEPTSNPKESNFASIKPKEAFKENATHVKAVPAIGGLKTKQSNLMSFFLKK